MRGRSICYWKICLTGTILLVCACLDPIEFERPKTLENAIAIQGKLAKGETDYVRVTIKKVFDFLATPALIKARMVTLYDEMGNSVDIPSRQNGVHYLEFDATNSSISIDYNQCYRLEVSLFDDRKYESEIACLLPVPQPANLVVSKIKEPVINGLGDLEQANLLEFSIDTPLKVSPEQPNARLLWEIETVYKFSDSPEFYGRSCFPIRIDNEKKTCFFTESTFDNYIPFDGSQVNADYIKEELIWKVLPNWIFAEGNYITVFQQSLTEKAIDYWKQVHQLTTRTGGFFEATDAKVITNFSNVENPTEEIYGYFYATEEKLIRTYVSPEFAESPRPFCPEVMPFGTPPSNCCNCLTNANSTLEQPAWWVE